MVLWEAVTGHRLFKGNNEAATLHLTLTDEIAAPSQHRPDLPIELEAILLKALERDRELRYATAAEMRDELEAWLSTRELTQAGSLALVMRRLFAREMRQQRQLVQGLLQAQADPAPQSGMTLVAHSLRTSATASGLRGTQVSSVTDLMDELNRQRRVTTRLLGGLVVLVACGVGFGAHWTFTHRPEPVASFRAPPTERRAEAPLHVVATPVMAQPPSVTTAAASASVAASVHAAPFEARPWSPAAHFSRQPRPTRAAAARLEPAPSGALPVVPPPAPAEVGLLNLDTTPWSVVSWGGRVLGQTPIIGAALPVGTHTLVLTNSELGLKTTYQVTINARRTTARRVGLD